MMGGCGSGGGCSHGGIWMMWGCGSGDVWLWGRMDDVGV